MPRRMSGGAFVKHGEVDFTDSDGLCHAPAASNLDSDNKAMHGGDRLSINHIKPVLPLTVSSNVGC